jgi:hypothetical protein
MIQGTCVSMHAWRGMRFEYFIRTYFLAMNQRLPIPMGT